MTRYHQILMTSVVIHYKELALKGRNRPWFIKILIRNLRTALADLDIRSIRSVMGRIEIDLGAATSWESVRERVRHVFGIANFSYAARAPHDFETLAAAILDDLGDRDRGLVPRVGAARRQARAVHVAADRTRSRRPHQGGQGLARRSGRCGADDSPRGDVGSRVLFFRQGARRGRTADRYRRSRRVSAFGRHRLAGRGLPDDAAWLLGAAGPFSQLSDPLPRVAGEGARDRGAAHEIPASIAAAARALRRAAAAGRARRAAGASRGHLPAPDAADRRGARAQLAGARAGHRRGRSARSRRRRSRT